MKTKVKLKKETYVIDNIKITILYEFKKDLNEKFNLLFNVDVISYIRKIVKRYVYTSGLKLKDIKDFTLTDISKVPMNGDINVLFYWFAFTDPVTKEKERITFCDTTDNIDFNNRAGLRAWKC